MHSLRFFWFTALALMFAAPAAGISRDFCVDPDPEAVQLSRVWRIDADLAEALDAVSRNGSIGLTDDELQNAVDQTLQNVFRQSRGRVRTRISSLVEQCSSDDGDFNPCIVANDNSTDDTCGDPEILPLAYTQSCFIGGNCRIVFCPDNMVETHPLTGEDTRLDWGGALNLQFTLEHEFIHAWELLHVEDCGAPTSDGVCEGELMCATASASPHLTHGDGAGVRTVTNFTPDFKGRQVRGGSKPLGNSAFAMSSGVFSGWKAIFQPRIDCAVFPNSLADCVAVVGYLDEATHVYKTAVFSLSDWSASGWGSVVPVAVYSAGNHFPPDVALAPDGAEAWISSVSWNNNNAFVQRVDMATGSVTSSSLGFKSALPTRIDWDGDVNAAVIVSAQQGNPPKFRGHRASWTGTSISISSLDFGNLDDSFGENGTRLISGDFDFDCRYVALGVDECVLVAVLQDETSATSDIGKMFSRHFSVASNGAVTMDTAWTLSAQETAQSVVGVVLSSKLSISQGRRSGNGSSANSRYIEFNGFDVAPGSYNTSFTHRSDANSCDNVTANGISIGAATPHGGVPIAWCPSTVCGGSGTIKSLHLDKDPDPLVFGDEDFCW